MKELYTALINAQKEIKNPPKDTKGYGYSYTDLSTLINEVKPILAKHGLAPLQMIINGKLITRLIHESGQHIEFESDIIKVQGAKMNEAQSFGAGATYSRRYALSALLCVASEDDTDGAETKPSQPITASANNLDYTKDIIFNCKTISALDALGIELAKKKWSAVDKEMIQNMFDEARTRLGGK